MLEIYNEKVRDLLNPSDKKGGLRVRQHPKKGFYADGLKTVPVSDYKDIEQRMEEGTTNRTVAATNMNATSRYSLLCSSAPNTINFLSALCDVMVMYCQGVRGIFHLKCIVTPVVPVGSQMERPFPVQLAI